MIVDWRRGRLHEEDLLAANRVEKLHRNVTVRITIDDAGATCEPNSRAIVAVKVGLALPLKIVNSFLTSRSGRPEIIRRRPQGLRMPRPRGDRLDSHQFAGIGTYGRHQVADGVEPRAPKSMRMRGSFADINSLCTQYVLIFGSGN